MVAVNEHRFRVMASQAHVVVVGGAQDDSAWAERRLRALESRWSRFDGSSDVARINRARGAAVVVHPDTVVLLESMQHAHRLTAGAYDPTMLCEVLAAGYDRSIDDRSVVSVTVDLPATGHSVTDVVVDRAGCRVEAPRGLGLDPGGIGKGLAADLIVMELIERGAAGALACIGGDLACAGEPPQGDGWEIAVADPFCSGAELVRLEVGGGGVATSSTRTRRWRHRGRVRHHVLDPRCHRQSTTDLVAVTAIASAGWEAEALATQGLLASSGRVRATLESHGAAAIAVTERGEVIGAGGLSEVSRNVSCGPEAAV